MSVTPRLVWPTGALLGEGPIWCPGDATLRYVDIKGGAVHSFVPGVDSHKSIRISGEPSFIVPSDDGSYVVGSRNGLFRWTDAGLGMQLASITMPNHNRTNDATVDRFGRLWFGTMDDDEVRSTGAIYCLDGPTLWRMPGNAVVTNGPAVSTDGRILYHVDSGNRTIWRCELGNAPSLRSPELFARLREEEGFPDGIVIDSEDCLWVALWDGWGVHRYAPDGRLLLRVDLPCARVTKLAFGGEDLRTAYVTTARIGLEGDALSAQRDAGGLFAFEAPARGCPLPSFKLPRCEIEVSQMEFVSRIGGE